MLSILPLQLILAFAAQRPALVNFSWRPCAVPDVKVLTQHAVLGKRSRRMTWIGSSELIVVSDVRKKLAMFQDCMFEGRAFREIHIAARDMFGASGLSVLAVSRHQRSMQSLTSQCRRSGLLVLFHDLHSSLQGIHIRSCDVSESGQRRVDMSFKGIAQHKFNIACATMSGVAFG